MAHAGIGPREESYHFLEQARVHTRTHAAASERGSVSLEMEDKGHKANPGVMSD